MRIFCTVGTTKFDGLVSKVLSTEFLNYLEQIDGQLTLQYGNSKLNEIAPKFKQRVESYAFKDSIEEDLMRADLVISSGGAGTILESLDHGKYLVIVVNDTLQDNHQEQLSNQLHHDGYLLSTTAKELLDALKNRPQLKLWPKSSNQNVIPNIIKELLLH